MKTIIKLICCISALSFTTCKSTDDNSENSQTAELNQSVDTCSNESMAERRSNVFNRTSSCAADAIGFKLAEIVQKIAIASGEMAAFAKVIKQFNEKFGDARDLHINVAKGVLCARIMVGEYVPLKTMSYISGNLINQAEGAQLSTLDSLGKSIVTAGGSDVYSALQTAIQKPSAESLIKIASYGVGTFADIKQLFVTCSPIFTDVLSNNVPNIVGMVDLGQELGKLGVVAAIANCTAAGLFNAIDVNTEYQCLKRDLEYIEKQNASIINAEQAACEQLKPLASLPTTIPAMKNVLNDKNDDGNLSDASAARSSICSKTISAWGRCLASHPLDHRSQNWCEMLCKGDKSEVQDNIKLVLRASHQENSGIEDLVATYNKSCISDGNPSQQINDQIKPCVNLCRDGTGGYTTSIFYRIFTGFD